MKAVILAAGKGTRMLTLSDTTPKPLLNYEGKTLLEYKMEILPDTVSEIIIVIGHLGHLIEEKIGNHFNNIPIRYVRQDEQRGTAHALWQCQPHLDEDFIVMMGDDIYDKTDISTLSDCDEWGVLMFDGETGQPISLEKAKGALQRNMSDCIYTGACRLTPAIFDYEMVAMKNGEFSLPHTISQNSDGHDLQVVSTSNWKQITAPSDLQ